MKWLLNELLQRIKRTALYFSKFEYVYFLVELGENKLYVFALVITYFIQSKLILFMFIVVSLCREEKSSSMRPENRRHLLSKEKRREELLNAAGESPPFVE
jgi:hypothetical protein